MFGWMMPKGPNTLGLSKLHMLGMGPKMMKKVIKKHNAMTVPQLIELAQEQGVRMVGCTMTMDLLGIQKEEMIDGIEYGGVGADSGDADNGDVSFFKYSIIRFTHILVDGLYEMRFTSSIEIKADYFLDAKRLSCPIPTVKTNKELENV